MTYQEDKDCTKDKMEQKKFKTIADKIISIALLPTYAEAKELDDSLEIPNYENDFCGDDLYKDNHIYQVWNVEFIHALASFLNKLGENIADETPIIEVCAGNGKLSHHLRESGINILATDDHSWDYIKRHTGLVEKLGHKEALAKYDPKIVVASWIPNKSRIGIEVMEHPSVESLILIGEKGGGCCGVKEIYDLFPNRRLKEIERYSVSRIGPSEVELLTRR